MDDVGEILEYINDLRIKLSAREEVVREYEIELKDANDSITWWQNRYKALERENERLRTVDKDEEIDRLNNIIDSLEKWLKGLIENFNEDVSEPILHEQMTINLVYDYLENLKELKESKQ